MQPSSSKDDAPEPIVELSGGEPWQSLDRQLERLMAMQDECRRSMDSQLMQLSALQNFTRKQAGLAGGNGFGSSPRGQDEDSSHSGGVKAAPDPSVVEELAAERIAGASVPRTTRDSPRVIVDDATGAASEAAQGTGQVEVAALAPADDTELVAGTGADAPPAARVSDFQEEPRRAGSFPVMDLQDYCSTALSSPNLNWSTMAKLPPIKDGIVPWMRVLASNLLLWRFFEPLMGLIIVLNSVNIGWTIDRELQNKDTNVQAACEAVFFGIFTLELGLRVFVNGLRCLKLLPNTFDSVLILVTGTAMVTEPLLALWGSEDVTQYLGQLMILRMLRLLRLARAVRLIASFRSLWKLVQGLWHCFSAMMSALLLMFIAIFIFACFGAELITKQLSGDPEVGTIVAASFSTIPTTILTLSQFIAMDSTAVFVVPLVHRSPVLAIYFFMLVAVLSIALMNLVTALLVEDSINKAQMDEEMKSYYTRQRLRTLEPAMRELFRSLDQNGDGSIEVQEVVQAVKAGNFTIPDKLREFINPARILDLFEAIDADQSGDISEDELVSGLRNMALTDVSMETMQTLHILRMIKKDVSRLAHRLRSRGQTDSRSQTMSGSAIGHALGDSPPFRSAAL